MIMWGRLLAIALAMASAIAPEQSHGLQDFGWSSQMYQSLEPMRVHQLSSPISQLTGNPFVVPLPQMAPLVAGPGESWASPSAPVQQAQVGHEHQSSHDVSNAQANGLGSTQDRPVSERPQPAEEARTPESKVVEPAPRQTTSPTALAGQDVATEAPKNSHHYQQQQQATKSELGELRLAHSGKILDTSASVNGLSEKPTNARPVNSSSSTSHDSGNKSSSANYAKALTAANIALQVLKPRNTSSGSGSGAGSGPAKPISVAAVEQSIINQHSSGGANSFARVSNTQRLVPHRQRDHKSSHGQFYSSELSHGQDSNRVSGQTSNTLASIFENLISGVNSRSSIVKAMGDNRLARTLSNVGKTIGSNKYVAGAAAASALAALGLTVSKLFSPYALSSKYSEPLLGSGSMPIASIYQPFSGYSDDRDNFAYNSYGQSQVNGPGQDSLHLSGSSQLASFMPANSQNLNTQFEQPLSQYGPTLSPSGYEPSSGHESPPSYQLTDYQTVTSGLQQATTQQQQQPQPQAQDQDKVVFVSYQKQAEQAGRQQPFGYPTSGSDVGGYYGSYYTSPAAQGLAPNYNPSQSYPSGADGYQTLTANSNANEQSKQQLTGDQMLASASYASPMYQWQPYGAASFPQPWGYLAARQPSIYSSSGGGGASSTTSSTSSGSGIESGRRSGSVAIRLNQASRDKISQYLNQMQLASAKSYQPARGRREPTFSAGSFVPIVSSGQPVAVASASSQPEVSHKSTRSSRWSSVKLDDATTMVQPSGVESPPAQQVQLVSVSRRHTEVLAGAPGSDSKATSGQFEDNEAQHGASYELALADRSQQQARQVQVSPKARLSRTTNKLASGAEPRPNRQQHQQQKPLRQREKPIDRPQLPVGLTQIDAADLRPAGSRQPQEQQQQQVETAPAASANSSSILTANEDFSTLVYNGADQSPPIDSRTASQDLPAIRQQQQQPRQGHFDGSEMNNGMRLVELGQLQASRRPTDEARPAGASATGDSEPGSLEQTNNQSPSGNASASSYPLTGQPAAGYFGLEDSIQEAPSSGAASLSMAAPDAANLQESGPKQTATTSANKDKKAAGWEATPSKPSLDFQQGGKSPSQLIEVVVAPQAGSLVLANGSQQQQQQQQAKIAANHQDKYQASDLSGDSALLARSPALAAGGQWPINGYF